jgi:hypothetical protein
VDAEAYRVGSAALVPYHRLRHLLQQGRSITQIAREIDVSTELSEDRIKVNGFWNGYERSFGLNASTRRYQMPLSHNRGETFALLFSYDRIS